MPISLSSINQEDLNALEKGEIEPVLYKGSQIEFIYNKLNLGEGKLYILEKKLIWVKENSSNKKKVTNFKELATNNIYLNHYEKNKEFYLHLLNDVNNISIDSSNIALHAISSDKKICDGSCVYIQLNTDIFDNSENEKGNKDTEDSIKSDNIHDNDDENNSDDDIPYDQTVTPEILLICKNESENEAIFRQLSNMDNCFNGDDEEDEDEDEDEDGDEDEYEEDNDSLNEDEKNKVEKQQ